MGFLRKHCWSPAPPKLPGAAWVCSRPPSTHWKMQSGLHPFGSSVASGKSMIREISVEELKARRDQGENPVVLDVREDWELQLARIPDVLHVPMNQVPGRLGELS